MSVDKERLLINRHPFDKRFVSFLLVKFLKGYNLQKLDSFISTINYKDDKYGGYLRRNLGVYQLFGHFDLLSINSVQYLFNNTLAYKGLETLEDAISSSCCFAGITFKFDEDIENKICLLSDDLPFVGFTQIKLNSYYLFADHAKYLDLIISKIKEIVGEYGTRAIINYSFSSYELTLCQFGNTLPQIKDAIKDIRLIKIDLELYPELTRFYNSLDEQVNSSNVRHFISDTLTHYGIKVIRNPSGFDYPKLENLLNKNHDNLKFYVDLKIKPGHIPIVLNHFKDLGYIDSDKHRFLSGRFDLELKEVSASEFPKLFGSIMFLNSKLNVHESIRQMYTKLAFIDTQVYKDILFTNGLYNHRDKLLFSELTIKPILDYFEKMHSYDTYLKVSKVFSYYNEGIKNPLTFNLYVDFFYYLVYFIENYKEFEIDTIHSYIDSFEKAHYVRHFHEYHSDESEVFLGNNISVQSLASDIDTLFKIVVSGILRFLESKSVNPLSIRNIYGRSRFLDIFEDTVPQIAYIHDSLPYAKGNAANFNIPSVFNPEIFFNYLVKEALVAVGKSKRTSKQGINSDYLDNIFDNLGISIKNYLIQRNETIFEVFLSDFEASYLIEDFLRFIILFDSDFENYLTVHVTSIMQAWMNLDSENKFLNWRLPYEVFRLSYIRYLSCILLHANEGVNLYEINNNIIYNAFKESYGIEIPYYETFNNFWIYYFSTNKEKLDYLLKINRDWNRHVIAPEASATALKIMKEHISEFCILSARSQITGNVKGGLYVLPFFKDKYNDLVQKTVLKLSIVVSSFKSESIYKMKYKI